MQQSVILLIASCAFVRCEFYDVFSGNEINRTRYEEYNRLRLVPFCAIEVAPCDPYEPRRMDSSCINPKYPSRGTTLTPFRRLLPPTFSAGGGLPTAKSGKPLPLVRPLRVALMSDGRQASEWYTHNVANYNVFITGDVTSVHDTVNYVAATRVCCQPSGRGDPRCIPVEVQDDDLHLRRSNVRCMNLTRAVTYQRLGCVSDDVPPERVNLATPMLDLSVVYGQDERGARGGREGRGGRLKGERVGGAEWPPSGGPVCINNQPPAETRCHNVPSNGANAVLGMNLVFIWFYRSHNAIARSLQDLNPCWNDDQLYYTAREINIGFFLQIMYYEMMTELLGWDFLIKNQVIFHTRGHVNDYDPSLAPGCSIEYVVATRWFHTVQEGRLKLYTKDGRQYDELAVVDMILRTGALAINNTIDGVTQGCFRQPQGAIDALVDPDIGERILGRLQFASDVLSSDMMKGRDAGLPPYNEYRKLCGLPEAKRFKDLLGWMDRIQVEALATFYEDPDDIDLYAGLLAERAMPGAALSATLSCIMAEQLRYWRRADRFWYENSEHPGAFSEEQLYEIRKMTLAKLICRHGDGVDAVQPNAFLVTGPGNEITKCSEYEMPNLDAFRDDRCYPKTKSGDRSNPSFTDYLTYGNTDTNRDNILKSKGNSNFYPSTTSQGYPNIDKVEDRDYPRVNPILTSQEYPINSAALSKTPDVKIDPDASVSNKDSPRDSIKGYANSNPSTPSNEGLDIYPGVSKTPEYPSKAPASLSRNQEYPYDMQNYGKSNSNPFRPR